MLFYANDAALIAEKDDPQRFLFRFTGVGEKYIITLSVEKTKSLLISKNYIRYKLASKKIKNCKK